MKLGISSGLTHVIEWRQLIAFLKSEPEMKGILKKSEQVILELFGVLIEDG
jgi:hypothetical protein